MDFSTFDHLDCAYIARLILRKLDFTYDHAREKNLLHTKNIRVQRAITYIEKIEPSWHHITANTTHLFGRKELNEVIKLWSVPKKSAEVLENLVILSGAHRILEIGTSAGYAALHLANGAMYNHGQVYTLEFLPKKIALARTNFANSGLPNITLIEGDARRILKTWEYGALDFVFLDADKENYGSYLDMFLPHLITGGLIVADNVNDYGHLMTDYLQRVTGTHLPQSRADSRLRSYYIAALDNGLTITTKIAD